MKLIRCGSCRYSFERVDGDTRRECPQCGAVLEAEAEADTGANVPPNEAIEDRKTRKIHIIPKPKD
ncbi:MAG TPA: hypothetical protein VHB97_26245 [Polyangia bacterium]|nr:hypothetical protein [Polyangia bacterium]